MAALLSGSHLILSNDDGMVDSDALQHAADHANSNGSRVLVHTVDSTHNAERDDPEMILDTMCEIMQPLVTSTYHSPIGFHIHP
jgi:hypothetical protein